MQQRKTSDLRKGRIDLPGARYFVTCCAKRPENRLIESLAGANLVKALEQIEMDGDVSLACSTIMPDHIHLLFFLTGRLPISRVVAKMKVLSGLKESKIKWQANFFEHRLRPDESAGNYARYIFMNPYRAGFAAREREWPYWRKGRSADFDFIELLDDNKYPPVEWLALDWESFGIVEECVGEETL